jgi:hypothetical protein
MTVIPIGGCYVKWLLSGCQAFMPFISDFGGGETALPFKLSLCSSSVAMLPVWYAYYVRKIEVPNQIPILVKALAVTGYFCEASLFITGYNPMMGNPRENYLHTAGSIGVFGGGALFLCLCVASNRTPIKAIASWDATVAGVTVIVLALGVNFFFHGYRHMGHAGSITQMQQDYPAYCRGEGSTFHSNGDLNRAAICEWILVTSLIVNIFVELHHTLMIPRLGGPVLGRHPGAPWPRTPTPSEGALTHKLLEA